MPALLGVEQDGDFAVLLDGDSEVGNAVMVEIRRRLWSSRR